MNIMIMNYKRVFLKPGKEESLKRFHPWVFSGAIAKVEGNPEEGEVVDVYTSDHQFIACGHYQIGSITVRVLSFTPERIDYGFWKKKLSAAKEVRIALGLVDNKYGERNPPLLPSKPQLFPSGTNAFLQNVLA